MTYLCQAFEVRDLDQAKDVVLSPDPSRPDKFITETQDLILQIDDLVDINDRTRVLDVGCGMGRVARQLILRYGCVVTGLDISSTMLYHAVQYMRDLPVKKFIPTQQYPGADSQDLVLAIFCLQHAENPSQDIDRIQQVLRPGGQLILVNAWTRFVPSGVDSQGFVVWTDDGFDVHEAVGQRLQQVNSVAYSDPDYRVIVYKKQD